MSRCPTVVRVVALAALVLASPSREARAELINYGGGLIYDSEQDLTWLDPFYAQPAHTAMMGDPLTCGESPCDWFYTWTGATSWVADLDYEGYDDWRLPSRTDPSSFGGDNEVRRMLSQLSGWEFGPNIGDSYELLAAGDGGPFADQPAYYFIWLHDEPYTYTHYMGYDIPDHLDFSGNVRAVRSGAPVSKVPEPATLALVGLGALAAGWRIRRLRSSRRGA